MIFIRLNLLLLSLFLVACSGNGNLRSESSHLINEIIIKNETQGAIQDAQLKVEKFNRLFACSHILSKTECSTSFPQRPYEGNLISISWKQDGRVNFSKPIRILTGKNVTPGVLMKGIIVIKDSGYEAYLKQ